MHRSLAEALLRAGRTAAALHCYWRILALEPSSALAFVHVGDTLVTIKPEGGNDAAAASCYQRALILNPECGPAHLGLGLIQQRNGDTATAERGIRAAIAVDSRVSSFHAALANLLLEQKQYASASDSYRRAIALQPASPVLLDKLGDSLGHMGQKQRAQACYDRASELRVATERVSSRRASTQYGETSFSTVAIPWAGDAVPLAVTLRNIPGSFSSRGMPVQ
jgi:tetratricopeptide (TPR) repeat protein